MSTEKLALCLSQDLSYCMPEEKNKFHREAKSVLKKVALALGLRPSNYDISSSKGGIAGSGEVMLQTDCFYISIGQHFGGGENQVLYRKCAHRKDSCGGQNNYTSASKLLDINFLNTLSNY